MTEKSGLFWNERVGDSVAEGKNKRKQGGKGQRAVSRPYQKNETKDDGDDHEAKGLLLYGRNPIKEAIASKQPVEKIFVVNGDRQDGPLGEILAAARQRNIAIVEISQQRLEGMVSSQAPGEMPVHQGIAGLLAPMRYAEIADMLHAAREAGEPPFLLVLDSLEDPRNLGAILRTAAAAGVHGVIIPKHRAVGINGTVIKVSAGTAFSIPIARETNLVRCVEKLKKEGLWIAGADMAGEDMYAASLDGPLALIIGSEGEGIAPLLKKNCDFLVSIPMAEGFNSLNASVSAAVLIYEKRRRDRVDGHGR